MAPPPPPNSFFADQIAQDAFDANLNKTVFLIALAFAVLIQVCVLVYLAWLVVRRCCFSRSRDDAVEEEGEGDVDSVQDGGERKCAKEDLEVPSLPREPVLPGLVSSSTQDTLPPIPSSRHHRSPSLRESIFGSPSSEAQPDDSAKPASGSSSSWFNLRWSWEVPVQIDLERAASASPSSPSAATSSASPATFGSDSVASVAAQSTAATPDSFAMSTSIVTTSLANPTSAPFSVATPTQILSSELKQAHLQVPRIVISPPFSSSSSPTSSPSSSPASSHSSPDSSTGTTIDFEMDVDSALGHGTDQYQEQGEGEEIQTQIDTAYLYVPPTSCYPPRELVESPSGRGFIFPSSSFTSSLSESSPSPEESTSCQETGTETRKTMKTRTKSKIAKRKSPGAYENANTSSPDENATQPTKTKEKSLSARVFGALADLSNLHFTGLTARPSPLGTASSDSASPSSFRPSITPASSASLELPTTSNSESFFSRCEEALYDIESSGHGGVW